MHGPDSGLRMQFENCASSNGETVLKNQIARQPINVVAHHEMHVARYSTNCSCNPSTSPGGPTDTDSLKKELSSFRAAISTGRRKHRFEQPKQGSYGRCTFFASCEARSSQAPAPHGSWRQNRGQALASASRTGQLWEARPLTSRC